MASSPERTKVKVSVTRGNELLRSIASVDPRIAEGLRRDAGAPPSTQELEQLLELEKRKSITDPYQCFLFDVQAMHKRGNFKGKQGEAILQRIRSLGEKGETLLDLSGFSVRDDFALLMVDFLRSKSCRLTTMNLSRTQIGIEGATAIARAVNGTLESLQFSDAAIPIAEFRKRVQTTSLGTLSGKGYTHLDAVVIGTLVERESRKLEKLDVSQNRLTGNHSNVFHGIEILVSGMKKCPRLREINLRAVDLRAEGLTELANSIASLRALEKLDLSSNAITLNSFGDRNLTGVDAFCNALWQVPKLKDLSLAQNGLDYVACTSIATMLTVNQRLKRLDLSSNPIAEAGAVQLALGIKKTSSLEELDISACGLTCEALGTITASIHKFSRTIQVLSLRDNPGIRSRGYKVLASCLSVNPVLRTISINPPPKYDSLVAKIHDLVTVNASLVALRRDFKSFDFESLSEVQRTNFIEKLEELSESELQRLYGMNVVEGMEIGKLDGVDAAVTSLRYYSEMQQYTPLKRLLWVLESGARQATVEKRPLAKDKPKPRGRKLSTDEHEEDDDEEDIWDYPLC